MGLVQSLTPCCDYSRAEPDDGAATTAIPMAGMHRQASAPVNTPDTGPFGLGLLPHVKEVLKAGFLKAYLTKLYNTELGMGEEGRCRPNCAVAHASLDPEMNTMNIALPDLTAEYWCTFVPPGMAPVFRLKFPQWSCYSALTAYDTAGFPVASLNARQVAGGVDPRLRVDEQGRVVVALMHGTTWDYNLPLCVLFRVYRPEGIDITPPDALPEARLVNANYQLEGETLEDVLHAREEDAPFEPPVPQEEALERGRAIGLDFNEVISSKIKTLHKNQFGSQFFYPNSVGGLFVNANATYVCAFLSEGHHGMKITATVPEQTRDRKSVV